MGTNNLAIIIRICMLPVTSKARGYAKITIHYSGAKVSFCADSISTPVQSIKAIVFPDSKINRAPPLYHV
jgi:hypothetical protein